MLHTRLEAYSDVRLLYAMLCLVACVLPPIRDMRSGSYPARDNIGGSVAHAVSQKSHPEGSLKFVGFSTLHLALRARTL
jgi:hypothetical protein